MRRFFWALMMLLTIMILMIGCGIPQEIQQELSQLRAEKTQWQTEKAELNAKITELNKQISDLAKQNSELSKNILKDPTYSETVAFMKADKTEQDVPYDHGLAGQIVTENARKAGLNCYRVVARVKGGKWGSTGYGFIGFNTTDRGWVYFCTTSICADQEAKIVIGEKLHKSNPTWPVPDSDDTVVSIHYVP